MTHFYKNLDAFIVDLINRYNANVVGVCDQGLREILINSFYCIFGDIQNSTKLVDSISTLATNDLDVGDAYYTKTDGEPTLKKFMVNEARLRQANESRGRMKNQIDSIFVKLVGWVDTNCNKRITNIDSLSALLDRLITERIKEYNFRNKQNKLVEAEFQQQVALAIIDKISELFIEVIEQKGYCYISEKRTFDESKLINDVNKVLKDIKND